MEVFNSLTVNSVMKSASLSLLPANAVIVQDVLRHCFTYQTYSRVVVSAVAVLDGKKLHIGGSNASSNPAQSHIALPCMERRNRVMQKFCIGAYREQWQFYPLVEFRKWSFWLSVAFQIPIRYSFIAFWSQEAVIFWRLHFLACQLCAMLRQGVIVPQTRFSSHYSWC